MIAVTFDFGQTLAELDLDLLANRVAERGAGLDASRAQGASAAAWAAYGAAKRQWLWTEQPSTNLWRRPIAGMFELVRDLCDAKVPLGVVSNSEGKLNELCTELGIRDCFSAFADSGVLGIEKPEPAIFEWTAERLRVPTSAMIHVGDAWDADVVGALGVGARAVWFAPSDDRALPEGVLRARDAAEVRAALTRFGL